MTEKKKYDVGILGVWMGCNYGSIMTYYALNRVIGSMGYSVLMVDKMLPASSNGDVEHQMTHSRRFANEHYHIAPALKLADYGKLNELCDAFVIGSDQCWNYGISKSAGKSFYLDFVNDQKKKIAYATSFGHGIDFAPEPERAVISRLMKRFDAISLREDDGVRLCRDVYGVDSVQVLDPVFLVDADQVYKPLAEKSSHREEEPFIAAYILDPTPEKREALLHVSEKLGGIKIINLLDGLPWKFEENRRKMNLPNCIENLQVEDWLYYLSHAQFVITDSCHGASFAMIFRKNFIPITNKTRGFSRFRSLVDLFGFRERLVTDVNRILTDDSLLVPMDYAKIDAIMVPERIRSTAWLKSALLGKNVIEYNGKYFDATVATKLDARYCTGCSACVNVCPVKTVSLQPDAHGYYRRQVDFDRCMNCGLCAKICPAIKLPENKNAARPELFEFIAADEATLYHSSSGGIFPVMAKEAFRRQGAVSGVAWAEDFTAKNIVIDDIEDLPKLQKSKYLQSYPGTIFTEVKKRLEQGQFVLFTGTPCQVAGLRAFLRKDYDNLLAVDILCSNAPSAGFFKKYLEDCYPDGVQSYQFRYKVPQYGWDCYTVRITDKDGKEQVLHGSKQDEYQRVYHSHVMCSVHCEHCRYQSVPRFGDITIGDFWGIKQKDPSVDIGQGVSCILCNNEKGKAFLRSLPKKEIGVMKKVPLEWLGKNGAALFNSTNYASPKRDAFYEAILNKPFSQAVNYALKPNHGIYPLAGSRLLLQCGANGTHFSFDRQVWEEHIINDHTVLVTRPVRPEIGNYAIIPLNDCLSSKRSYVLKMRFMLRTQAGVYNFHIKDSGSRLFQVIYSHRVEPKNFGKWIEKEIVFTPDAGFYDEFMLGAAQLVGEDAYLAFDSIVITEQ